MEWDNGCEISSLVGGDVEATYNYDTDGTTENYYVATNMQGDVTQIYKEDGSVSAQYVYDSFGVVIAVLDANGKSI